ncbi:MAG: ATP-binding protein [Candidatus Thermoplasmatota archaeon]|nr:ATP-binding protein [Candidatus Thermoplasmatota archaeon]
METLLHRFNPWWSEEFQFPGIPRRAQLERLLALKDTRDVVLVAGMRRVGKTTLLRQTVHRLLQNVKPEKILYVSLDHLALREHSIIEIVERYRSMHRIKHNQKVYLFLDEVHLKEDYELQLKNLYDEGNAKIYASGSASLDIVMSSPHLTGRQRLLRIHPLSFSEYLEFTGMKISPADRNLYPSLAEEYVRVGGLPEYVLTRDMSYLQSLVDTILYRDVAGRHDMRSREALAGVLSLVAQSVGSPMSLRKISSVVGIPKETVSKIIELFMEAGLLYVVEREGKLSERKVSPRKIYLADTGFFNILTEDMKTGPIVENAVFLSLMKRGGVRYHRAQGLEVDFVTKGHAWESKYKSEINADDLRNIMALRRPRQKTMVTRDTEGEEKGIRLLPLWKLLLDEPDQ